MYRYFSIHYRSLHRLWWMVLPLHTSWSTKKGQKQKFSEKKRINILHQFNLYCYLSYFTLSLRDTFTLYCVAVSCMAMAADFYLLFGVESSRVIVCEFFFFFCVFFGYSIFFALSNMNLQLCIPSDKNGPSQCFHHFVRDYCALEVIWSQIQGSKIQSHCGKLTTQSVNTLLKMNQFSTE